MTNLVLCPGSRSGPLALAAGGLQKTKKLNIYTAIDERSAAFMALGISSGNTECTIVITTSGTAVANLLPAAVEANQANHSLIFITADRPFRLKNCGANQTVNQEEFLKPVCRTFIQGPKDGIHNILDEQLFTLIDEAWSSAHYPPGPVHLNIPFEEPLHASLEEQQIAWNKWNRLKKNYINKSFFNKPRYNYKNAPFLDFSKPGLILVGPWRSGITCLSKFSKALDVFQLRTGWKIFADPLSRISSLQSGLISHWDLLLPFIQHNYFNNLQILRLGPISCSRNLYKFLNNTNFNQLLITEGDNRFQDPLRLAKQFSGGLLCWTDLIYQTQQSFSISNESKQFSEYLYNADQTIISLLEENFTTNKTFTEPGLAYWINRYLPEEIPLMLSASTPIRDLISFSGLSILKRRCYSFRGASGIDGTLSLAMGLCRVLGKTLLVTGDLALLHDSNGWSLNDNNISQLIVLLIDNGGGAIFNEVLENKICDSDLQELFVMPQKVDHLALASSHGILTRDIKNLDELKPALSWAYSLNETVLLRVTLSQFDSFNIRSQINLKIEAVVI